MSFFEIALWAAGAVLVWFARDWIQKEKGWLTGRGVFGLALLVVSYVCLPLLPLAIVKEGPQAGLQQWFGATVAVATTTLFLLWVLKFGGFTKHGGGGDGNFLRGGQRVRA
jgi:hypothetical protein